MEWTERFTALKQEKRFNFTESIAVDFIVRSQLPSFSLSETFIVKQCIYNHYLVYHIAVELKFL